MNSVYIIKDRERERGKITPYGCRATEVKWLAPILLASPFPSNRTNYPSGQITPYGCRATEVKKLAPSLSKPSSKQSEQLPSGYRGDIMITRSK